MPALGGVLETCLYVEDLALARRFYEATRGFDPMLGEDRIVAYDLGPASVLILFRRRSTLEPIRLPGGVIPPHDGDGPAHVAFAVPQDSLSDWRKTFAAAEIAIEGEVAWPSGGESLYIRDPDGHLLEFATPGLWRNYRRDLRPET